MGEPYRRYQKTSFEQYNANAFNDNEINKVFLNNQEQLSTKQEPNVEYEQVPYYFVVSSQDRDVNLYPNVSNYVIHLPKEYKNIHSIEMIQAIIPDKNSVTSEPFLLLKIEELEDTMSSSSRHIADAFGIIQLCSPVTSGGFIVTDKRTYENTVKYFKIPKASLSKLTISITKYDGTLFNFGTDTPNPPNKQFQNWFVFMVVCLEKKRDTLNHRNVF